MSLEMFEKLLTGDIPDKYELPDTRYSDVFTLVQHCRVGAWRQSGALSLVEIVETLYSHWLIIVLLRQLYYAIKT